MIYAIAAMAENRVIGNHGVTPWHIPEEMKWFREITYGHTLVMGERTYSHLPKKLGGRKVIVASRHDPMLFDGDIRCVNLQGLLDQYRTTDETILVCGGASIYEQAMPYIDKLYLSIIPGNFYGDRFFPKLDQALKPVSSQAKNGFEIITYQR